MTVGALSILPFFGLTWYLPAAMQESYTQLLDSTKVMRNKVCSSQSSDVIADGKDVWLTIVSMRLKAKPAQEK